MNLGNGYTTDWWEQVFSRIEHVAATALRGLHRGSPLPRDSDERVGFAMWVAAQYLRTEGSRNQVHQVQSQMYRVMVTLMGKDGLRDFIESRENIEVSDHRLDAEWDDLTADYGTSIEPDSADHMTTLDRVLIEATAMLEQRQWMLLRFEHHSLLLSDHPITLLSDGSNSFGGGGGLADSPVIAMPLSRKLGLVMFREAGPDAAASVQKDTADTLNRGTVLNARNSVYSHPDDRVSRLFKGEWPEPRLREIGPVQIPAQVGTADAFSSLDHTAYGCTDADKNSFSLSDMPWPIPGRSFRWE